MIIKLLYKENGYRPTENKSHQEFFQKIFILENIEDQALLRRLQ